MKCKICQYENESLKAFATHLQTAHNLKSKQYTIDYLCSGTEPTCLECGEEVRYVAFEFKRYCKGHSSLAMSSGGKAGGKVKETWNKGETKETNLTVKKIAEKQIGEGNQFYGKKHSIESMIKMKKRHRISADEFCSRIDQRKEEFDVLTSYRQYLTKQNYLNIRCLMCNRVTEKTLVAFERGSRCIKCFPLNTNSKPQDELFDYILSLGIKYVIKNDREFIKPKELDIYLPEHNFAIEFNGLYWHCELYKGEKDHSEKTKQCDALGIQLFHIFSDEWEFKKNIIKSMIRNRLKLNNNKIFARKCEIREVSQEERAQFFEENHISGDAKSKIAFGLYNKEKLVCCLSLRKPFNVAYPNSLEIARFSTLKDLNVIGGFSKLLQKVKQYCKDNSIPELITYADLRFGKGTVYSDNGFQYIKETDIDYWYTDGTIRENRTVYKADQIRKLTESQVAKNHNVFKIYGCGSRLYKMEID